MFEKLRTFAAKHATKAAVATSVILAGVGFEGIAGATTYDPTSLLTGLAGSATSTASPILIAVTVALIPMFIVFLVVGWIKGLFRRR
jgi:hypothetical protein